MNPTSDQIGGIIRATVPMILTALVSFGLMDQTTSQALHEPIVTTVIAIGGVATAVAAVWSIFVNRPSAIIESAAALAPGNIKIVVGPKAPPDIKAVAADPAKPNIVSGPM